MPTTNVALEELWRQVIVDIGGTLPDITANSFWTTLATTLAGWYDNPHNWISGITTGGVVGNYAVINAALVACAAAGGGFVFLPPGAIGVEQTLVIPAGVWLGGQGGIAPYGAGALYGTVLVPTSGAGLSEIVHMSGAQAGLRDIGINAYGNTGTTCVLLDADELRLFNVYMIGGLSANTLDSTSSATNVNMGRVYSRAYNASSLAMNTVGSDWNGDQIRTFGGVTFGAAAGQWSPTCHFSQISGLTLLATVSADNTFSGCEFDSVNGSAPTALIELTSGIATMTGCSFKQNFNFSGFPMILNAGGVLNLVGGTVASPSFGAGGQFSCILSGAGTEDQLHQLFCATNSIPYNGSTGIATVLLSPSGGPAASSNVSYNGHIQRRYPDIASGVTKQSNVSVAVGLSGVFGAVTTISPDVGVPGFYPEELAINWTGVGGGETVTCGVTATYSDGTTGSQVTVSSTSSQEQTIGGTLYITLFKDAVYITSLAVVAKTSAASTSATGGFYIVARNEGL